MLTILNQRAQSATTEEDIIDLTAHIKVMLAIPLNSVGILTNIKKKRALCALHQIGCSAQRNFSRNRRLHCL